MKIAIDLTQIPKQLTGVGFYMENLIKGLADIDHENRYYLFIKNESMPAFKVPNSNFKYIIVPKYPYIIRVLWEQIILPFRLLFERVQLLHSPHYTIPWLGWWFKRAVTFPDLTFFLFPEMHLSWKVNYFQNMMKISARVADKIISISYSTTRDMIDKLSIPPHKIATTQLAVSSKYKADIDKQKGKEVAVKYQLPSEYILFIGTIEPRKNILGLIKAYLLLPNLIRDKHKLVIVGKKGWHYDELFDFLSKIRNKEDIILLGYVSEEDLPYIYNYASLFVYPSFYEGFGIPVLEAMKSGVPVISSNVSSMPEVLGDAGILINPNEPEEIKSAMEKALNDKSLSDKMRQEGIKQAQKFSWQRCAEETLAVYYDIIINREK